MSIGEQRFTAPTERCPHPERWTSLDSDSTEHEVALLVYGLVRGLQPDYCVETGTAHGAVSEQIGRALRDNGSGRLVTIEVDLGLAQQARRNMRGERVKVVHGDSRNWKPEQTIDFAWIDSSPEWAVRLEEFELYLPYMRTGTIVGFHDTAPGHGKDLDYFSSDYRSHLARALGGKARFIHLPTPRGVTIAEVLHGRDCECHQ